MVLDSSSHNHSPPSSCVQAFAEVLASNEAWSAPMEETYKLLDIDPASVQPLDSYLKVGGVGGGRVMILGRPGGEGREG